MKKVLVVTLIVSCVAIAWGVGTLLRMKDELPPMATHNCHTFGWSYWVEYSYTHCPAHEPKPPKATPNPPGVPIPPEYCVKMGDGTELCTFHYNPPSRQ
jgi:hypothetical protein